MSNHIFLIGLGNPGDAYKNNRHNVGFMAIDLIAEIKDFPSFSSKFSAQISSKIINGFKITLVKPQTYMNLSGESVSKILNFYKLSSNDSIVIYDDFALDLGRIKIKHGGGSGGHNGIKSIDQHIGKNYYRIRIGIGSPPESMDISNYVLGNFSTNEQSIIEKSIQQIILNFPLLLEKKFDMLMNIIARNNQTKLTK